MDADRDGERFETVIVGGGQAGLAAGYHLAKRNRSFVILEANDRIGDSWRTRWDSLRLFTPARHDALPGARFPGAGWRFPTKDEMGDYLEAYASRFDLLVRTDVRVTGISRDGDGYVVAAGERRIGADNVVIASGPFQIPNVPSFASELDPGVTQLHSRAYRSPSQLQGGGVLVVGAGNSGAEIAREAAANGHHTWLSGRDVGHVPFDIEGTPARLLLEPLTLRFVFHRVLTTSTPIGRRMRSKAGPHGGPLIRVKPKQLAADGIERVQRVAGIRGGRPELADGRVLDVTNVVWATGFRVDYSWIDLPAFASGEPVHARGVVAGAPGIYLLGLEFLYAFSSVMVHGVGRDAEHIAKHIASRAPSERRTDGVAA